MPTWTGGGRAKTASTTSTSTGTSASRWRQRRSRSGPTAGKPRPEHQSRSKASGQPTASGWCHRSTAACSRPPMASSCGSPSRISPSHHHPRLAARATRRMTPAQASPPRTSARSSSRSTARSRRPSGTSAATRGLDIAARTGTPIVASRAGTVTFAGSQSGYGNVVYLTHEKGVKTRYADMSRITCRRGLRSTKGQDRRSGIDRRCDWTGPRAFRDHGQRTSHQPGEHAGLRRWRRPSTRNPRPLSRRFGAGPVRRAARPAPGRRGPPGRAGACAPRRRGPAWPVPSGRGSRPRVVRRRCRSRGPW